MQHYPRLRAARRPLSAFYPVIIGATVLLIFFISFEKAVISSSPPRPIDATVTVSDSAQTTNVTPDVETTLGASEENSIPNLINSNAKPLHVENNNGIVRPKLRVICAIGKDEGPFLEEWFGLHLSSGFDRVFFCDHKSTDNTEPIAKSFPPGRIDYLYVNWTNDIGHKRYSHLGVQVDCYRYCFQKYWSETELFAVLDVDEFMFPSRESWDAPDILGDAMRRVHSTQAFDSSSGKAVVIELPCYRFGVNGFLETPMETINSYRLRGPYGEAEIQSVQSLLNETAAFCSTFTHHSRCLPTEKNGLKSIYFPNNDSVMVIPGIHKPEKGVKVKMLKGSRNAGIDCNHIWLRSVLNVRRKAAKHGTRLYHDIGAVELEHGYHRLTSVVEDFELIDLQKLLRKNGRWIGPIRDKQ